MSLLFIRVPLLDPNHFLERWKQVFGWIFSKLGLLLWCILLGFGLYIIIPNFKMLVQQNSDVLNPENLPFLYLSFIIIKVVHEFCHAFACKTFSKYNQNAGEVHKMGIMFLVFVPIPFVDASSAWAFRNKWHRAIVGLSGVMAELAIAAIAAIVWFYTSTGTLHIIAYNIIFVASVSTLLFNGNPLLRFDAYYVLVDITEIPNLGQRSTQFLYYLVKRFVWGVTHAWNRLTWGERIWFVFYGLASTAYRIYISVRILLFLNDRLPKELFILVPFFGLSAVIGWIIVPFGKFIRYLATAINKLSRTRLRAYVTTLGFFLIAFTFLDLCTVPISAG